MHGVQSDRPNACGIRHHRELTESYVVPATGLDPAGAAQHQNAAHPVHGGHIVLSIGDVCVQCDRADDRSTTHPPGQRDLPRVQAAAQRGETIAAVRPAIGAMGRDLQCQAFDGTTAVPGDESMQGEMIRRVLLNGGVYGIHAAHRPFSKHTGRGPMQNQ